MESSSKRSKAYGQYRYRFRPAHTFERAAPSRARRPRYVENSSDEDNKFRRLEFSIADDAPEILEEEPFLEEEEVSSFSRRRDRSDDGVDISRAVKQGRAEAKLSRVDNPPQFVEEVGSDSEEVDGSVSDADEGAADAVATGGDASVSNLGVFQSKKRGSKRVVLNLNRGQDVGRSNNFGSAFNIRGGLSNFALLQYDPYKEVREFSVSSNVVALEPFTEDFSSLRNVVLAKSAQTFGVTPEQYVYQGLNQITLFGSSFRDPDHFAAPGGAVPYVRQYSDEWYRSCDRIYMQNIRITGQVTWAVDTTTRVSEAFYTYRKPRVTVCLLLDREADLISYLELRKFLDTDSGRINVVSTSDGDPVFMGGPPRVMRNQNPQFTVLAFEHFDLGDTIRIDYFAPTAQAGYVVPPSPSYLVPGQPSYTISGTPAVTVPGWTQTLPSIPGWTIEGTSPGATFGFWTGILAPTNIGGQDAYDTAVTEPTVVPPKPDYVVPETPSYQVPPSVPISIQHMRREAGSRNFVFDVDLSGLSCDFLMDGNFIPPSSVVQGKVIGNNCLNVIAFISYDGMPRSTGPGIYTVAGEAEQSLCLPYSISFTSTLQYTEAKKN